MPWREWLEFLRDVVPSPACPHTQNRRRDLDPIWWKGRLRKEHMFLRAVLARRMLRRGSEKGVKGSSGKRIFQRTEVVILHFDLSATQIKVSLQMWPHPC